MYDLPLITLIHRIGLGQFALVAFFHFLRLEACRDRYGIVQLEKTKNYRSRQGIMTAQFQELVILHYNLYSVITQT